jgi:hypothetical protein
MKPILRDPILDNKLLEEGYVVVPFLTEEEVAALRSLYLEKHAVSLEGMYATAHTPDLDLRMQMNDFIKETFKRPIAEFFQNVNPLGGSYIAKGKGGKGILNPHQDWNIVDENLYRSFNIWVPLVDLHKSNGAIEIIGGSHAWGKTYRSSNISFAYADCIDQINAQLTPLHMKTGEALIYDHRLIHASGENQSDQIRLATVYGVIPDEAEMRYYHQKDPETIEVYRSNKEFFLYGNIFEGPKGLEKIDELHIVPPTSKNKWLTVSIPAYNDSKSLVKLVEDIHQTCADRKIVFDILIINDGSSDNTLEVAQQLADKYGDITIVSHEKNLGFGPTLRQVFTLPKTEWVMFLPGDNQFPAHNLDTFLALKDENDFILGKRTIRKDSPLRILYAGFYNHLVSLLSGYPVADVNGIAFYKTAIFEKVQLNCTSSFIHAELFLEAHRNKYKVKEVAVIHKEREFGRGSGGKWTVIVPSVFDLFKYVFKRRINADSV